MNIEHRTSNSAGRETHNARRAFSLTEVLMSIGILAIGMLFIAGVFPVGIHFTTVAAERTIAAAAADEAFAKIKLYGVDANNWQEPFEKVVPVMPPLSEFAYPSTSADITTKRYWWSAICRKVSDSDVQVTVFISRKAGATTTYLSLLDPLLYPPIRPVAMPVGVNGTVGDYELTIIGNRTWINDGYTIINGATGQIHRVLQRYSPPLDDRIRLDTAWQGGALPGSVWVVPPAVGGGRYPCIAVYQKVIRF